MTRIILKRRKDEPVRRYHPWVFSGAIKRIEGEVENGDVVEIYANNGDFLAVGHYNNGSIAVRIISFEKRDLDQDFWNEKLATAYEYRTRIGLTQNEQTNCYRLIHAEGDGLPGLIIDMYNHHAVVQCHSIGMHKNRNEIAAALKHVFGEKLISIYDKSAAVLPREYALGVDDEFLYGEAESGIVHENGNQFEVNWVEGQKTGFFIDQRFNRQFLTQYVKDKTVLNAFCYSGGFSVYALQAGAKEVHSVDISAKAMELTDRNVALNTNHSSQHISYTADVLKFLKENDKVYDVMVVDPPAFAKSIKKRHNAVQGYKRLNRLALEQIASGGILFTFSCSQVVDNRLFYNTIVAAAIEANRKVRVMHHLSQSPDHPVSLFHPEGSYLKGLVVYVE